MKVQKLSISLPQEHIAFINSYATSHTNMSRSEIIKNAIYLLMQQELAVSYKEANREITSDFDNCDGDGLSEAW